MLTLQTTNHLKAIAILMMVCLHLFNTLNYKNLFNPLIFIGDKPLIYFISLFCDACVPIFAFISGYGLFYKYNENKKKYRKGNILRLKKLYINYWIILFIFAVLLGCIFQKDGYPGDLKKFLLNFTALDPSYNGAWWFFTTYVFFVLSSYLWFRFLEKLNSYFYLLCLFALYIIAFYFRLYRETIFVNDIMQWFYKQIVLYFCTLFQFMLGAFALKFNWSGVVKSFFSKIKFKNIILFILITLLFVIHAFIPNFIIAPFTGLGFIFLIISMDFSNSIKKILDYIAIHSTNIWLTHMFFFRTYFSEWTFSLKYVPLIYISFLFFCLFSSTIILFMNKIIEKKIG